jgi:isoleucyl-tRNA synthetase
MNAHKIILSQHVMKSKSYKHGKGTKKGEFKEFVTMEEGSGLVHTAPGHGAEDHFMGLHYNLPIVSPVDDEGKFTEEAGEFKGIFVKDADKIIAEKLEDKRLLVNFGWAQHTYPLCWRCKTPLIFRISKQWFFKVDLIKDKMIRENKKVKWYPAFGKERFHNWLDNATDWNISQQRYWGIPLPIWTCEKCKAETVIGSESELREKSKTSLPREIDLHKHVVDKIELRCEKCGGIAKRVEDTMNPWFDSGISTWASLGYPYRNKELVEKLLPADMICEAQDQIRGWFYSLMFCGVAAFDKSPYKAVSMMGWVLDEKGEKMSKSLGNVVWGEEALKKLGADILRLYYCWEVAPWEIQNFSFKTAEEIRKAMNILWNSYSFFTTYVTEDFKPSMKSLRTEDRWMLSTLNSMIEEVTNNLENFECHYAGRKLMNFVVNDLSRFYIKLIRDRVWVSEDGKDKLTALSVLNESLLTIVKLLAPMTPFISEDIYQNLSSTKKSVFESKWPKANKKLIDNGLEEEMMIARKIIDSCMSARQGTSIKLRWPVKEFLIHSENEKVIITVKNLKDIITFMCNSKDVRIVNKKPEGEYSESEFDLGKAFLNKNMDKELLEEAMFRELIREIQDMRKKNKFQVKEMIRLTLNSDKNSNDVLKKYARKLEKEVGAKEIVIGSLKGEFRNKLQFEDKVIEIGFDKL